jgi:CheY-like chemotaxis protein
MVQELAQNNSVKSIKCSCKERILVVDDTHFNILAVKLMIKEKFQLDVEEAANGQIAIDMFMEGL